MSSVSGTTDFDYSSIGKTEAYINAQEAANASKDQTLGQEDFLMLLTTQLECQDPTQPVDNSQMVSQMSQLSMVESLSSISEDMSSSTVSIPFTPRSMPARVPRISLFRLRMPMVPWSESMAPIRVWTSWTSALTASSR